jgi:hypothetical protein
MDEIIEFGRWKVRAGGAKTRRDIGLEILELAVVIKGQGRAFGWGKQWFPERLILAEFGYPRHAFVARRESRSVRLWDSNSRFRTCPAYPNSWRTTVTHCFIMTYQISNVARSFH